MDNETSKPDTAKGTAGKKKNQAIPIIIAVAAIAVIVIAVFIIKGLGGHRSVLVETIDGTVALVRDGADKDIFEGLKLIAKDTVKTQADGTLVMLIDSDKHVVAAENTCFSVNAAGNENSGKVTLDLEYGSTLITIDEKLNENSEFEVITPNCTCSVRGTTFNVFHNENGSISSIDVTDGVVNVKAGDDELELHAGESAIVMNDTIYKKDDIAKDFLWFTQVDWPVDARWDEYADDEYCVQVADMFFHNNMTYEEIYAEYENSMLDFKETCGEDAESLSRVMFRYYKPDSTYADGLGGGGYFPIRYNELKTFSRWQERLRTEGCCNNWNLNIDSFWRTGGANADYKCFFESTFDQEGVMQSGTFADYDESDNCYVPINPDLGFVRVSATVSYDVNRKWDRSDEFAASFIRHSKDDVLVPFDRDAELSDDELTEMFPDQINGGIEQGATEDISAGAVELPAGAESVLPIEE